MINTIKNLLNKIAADIEIKKVDAPKGPNDIGSVVKNITNVLMTVVGIAAVIMIIVGGLMYITSAGDTEKTKRAKDTILYAVIGLIIAILSFAIVSFVTTNIK